MKPLRRLWRNYDKYKAEMDKAAMEAGAEEKRMKLLFITVHMGGGAGKAIGGMARQCRHAGMDTAIIVLDRPENDKYIRLAREEGVSVMIMPSREVLETCMGACDFVILNWWGHPIGLKFIMELPRVKCRLLLWAHVNGCVYPFLPYEFLNVFSGILFTSEYSMENPAWSGDELIHLKKKTKIVYGMGEYDPASIVPKTEYRLNGKYIVGYVGTLNYAKLNGRFLTYCAQAIKRIPDMEIWLVGDLEEEIGAQIKAEGLENYVKVFGFVEDVSELMRRFDVLGYLLEEESYATTENVLLEAMACALPIIVLDNPVERHIMYEGVNGFLVHNEEEYAERLEMLRNSEAARRTIGEKARNYAKIKYCGQENLERFLCFCQERLSEEKTYYSFEGILGDSVFKNFCYFAGKSGEIFGAFVNGHVNEVQVRECARIFRGQAKGSIGQYGKYFPGETEFQVLQKGLEV